MKRAKLPIVPIRKAVLGLAPYNAPEEGRAKKLRLDFNENTVGCSPAVLRALSRMTAEEMANLSRVSGDDQAPGSLLRRPARGNAPDERH